MSNAISTSSYRDAAQRASASIAEVADPVQVCYQALARAG
jgi:hypothetical protein